MKWLLDQIYGANAVGDPYYEFFVDASALIPWWYPTLVFGIAALMVTARWHARTQYRRKAARAAVRVRKRTLRRIS